VVKRRLLTVFLVLGNYIFMLTLSNLITRGVVE